MAACIVCNQKTMPDDIQDAGDVISLCARLEKVLEETVPQGSVMCSSCQFDLAQIEMYYTLLTVFRKRYSETAKQRLHSLEYYTSRNLLQKTTYCSSNNLQLGTSLEISSPDIKLEIHRVRTVKEELQADKSVPMEMTNIVFGESLSDLSKEHKKLVMCGQEVHNTPQMVKTLGQTQLGEELPSACGEAVEANTLASYIDESQSVAFPAGVPKKCRRLAKKEPSNVSSAGIVDSPRINVRERKDQHSSDFTLDVSRKSVKKHKRPRKDASDYSILHTMKPGRPKKYKHSSESQSVGLEKDRVTTIDRSVYCEELESEECFLGEQNTDESDVEDPAYDPKLSSLTPMTGNTGNKTGDSGIDVDGASTAKRKRGRPRKDRDPSYVAAMVQRKQGRPKKTEEDPCQTFPCTLCEKAFVSRSRLKAHVKIHSSDRPFVCSICNKAFRGIGDLNAHMKIHLADRPFQCDICHKTFSRKNALQRHLVVHSDDQPFQCDQCERKFKAERHLKHHVKAHHMDGRKYLCNICGLALLTEGSLRNHIKTHNEARPFTCETCGRGFSTKAYLMNHELTHKADTREKYLCPICGKELLQKSYLPLHMKQHTGESKHACSVCNKSFSTSSGYKHHMTIHSGEKPYRCSECGKGFAGKGNLKAHMMSHTDERPHKCSCGQAFRSKVGMQKHMRANKHGECGGKSVRSESSKRQMSHSASVPVAAPPPTEAPVSFPAPLPLVHPLPIVAPLAIAEQYEMMSAYQTGPLYLGL